MLPEYYHERACRLFGTIARRIEEKNREQESDQGVTDNDNKVSTTTTRAEQPTTSMEQNATTTARQGNPLFNHQPLIPPELQQDLFWYVFHQRSRYLLDGTLNPNVKRYDRYTQQGYPEPNILLKDIIKPALDGWYIKFQGKITKEGVYTGEHWYSLHYHIAPRTDRQYMVPVKELDDIYWQVLAENLEHCDDFDEYAQDEEQTRAEKEKELKGIDEQIAACESAMAKLQKKLKIVDDPDLVADIADEV